MAYPGENQQAFAATSDYAKARVFNNSKYEEEDCSSSEVIVYRRRRNKQAVLATSPPRERKNTCDERPKTEHEQEPPKDLTLAVMVYQRRNKRNKQVVVAASPPKKRKIACSERPKTEPKPKKHLTLAEIKAHAIRSRLNDDAYTAVKLMSKSHVVRGFWLQLPLKFCLSAELPVHKDEGEVFLTLVGETETRTVKCVPHNGGGGLSAGWRGFAQAHNLAVGDVVLFHLTERTVIKVYIVRACTFSIGATTIRSAEGSSTAGCKKLQRTTECTIPKRKRIEVCAQRRVKFNPLVVQFGEEGIDYLPLKDCQMLDGVKLGCLNKSNALMNFKDFRIIVDGVIIDSKIPEHVRVKYYELCRSQSVLLHINVLPKSSHMLIAGMIIEIVNKADFIRACKLSTPMDDLEAARKTLLAIKQFGFDVDFLLTRLDQGIKMKLASDSSDEADKSY